MATEVAEVVVKNFKTAEYNEKNNRLEYILAGKNARTEGIRVNLQEVRLELVDDKDGKTVKAVVTSPEAVYDRARKSVSGDKKVTLTADNVVAEGIGFDAGGIGQNIHIRRDVRVVVNSSAPLFQKGAEGKDKQTERKEP